jgi:hypothetical protein
MGFWSCDPIRGLSSVPDQQRAPFRAGAANLRNPIAAEIPDRETYAPSGSTQVEAAA